jgi:hypothetical protein
MTAEGMPPEDPMRLSGAVWCEDHGRWECVRDSKRSGARCHGPAIGGLDRCRMHAGLASGLAKAKGAANLLAWSTAYVGDTKPLDPGQTVMNALHVSVLRAELLGELLRVQVEDQDYDGLIGVTSTAGRDGGSVTTGEQLRGLVRMEAEERDRSVKFAKAAHDMGIAERHIELQQAQAAIVVGAMRAAMDVAGSELLPGTRDAMLRAFLSGLQQVPELEAGESATPPQPAAVGRDGER